MTPAELKDYCAKITDARTKIETAMRDYLDRKISLDTSLAEISFRMKWLGEASKIIFDDITSKYVGKTVTGSFEQVYDKNQPTWVVHRSLLQNGQITLTDEVGNMTVTAPAEFAYTLYGDLNIIP